MICAGNEENALLAGAFDECRDSRKTLGGTIVIGISDKTKKVRESMRLMQKKSTIFFPRRKTAVNQCQIIKKNFLM